MVRFALVEVRDNAAAVSRVAKRLRECEITAVVDADAGERSRAAERFGAARIAASTAELHEQHDDAFDAWLVETPSGLFLTPHENRPLGLREEDWSTNRSAWMWGNPARFAPSADAVQQSFEHGQLGAPGLLRLHHWESAPGGVEPALRTQLDVACWLADQPVKTLFASAPPLPPDGRRSYIQAHLGFADDRMAVIDCMAALPAGQHYESLCAIGSQGAAYADDHRNTQLLFAGPRPQAQLTTQGDAAVLAILQEYLAAAGADRLPSCGAAEWKRANDLLAAVEKSLATGEAIRFPGDAAP